MGFLSKVTGAYTGGIIGDDVYGLDITGAKAAEKASSAANKQASAAETEMFEKNLAFQKEQEIYRRGLAQPWMQAGQRGLAGYESILNDPRGVANTAGYQFGLDQGTRATTTSASARGMGLSGNTLKALNEYGQNYGQKFRGQLLDEQMSMAKLGSGMTGSLMSGNVGYASNQAGAYQGQGTNMSNMYMNQGQIAANKATSDWNAMMGIVDIGASIYSGGMSNMMPGGGPGGMMSSGGGGNFMQDMSGYGSNMNVGL